MGDMIDRIHGRRLHDAAPTTSVPAPAPAAAPAPIEDTADDTRKPAQKKSKMKVPKMKDSVGRCTVRPQRPRTNDDENDPLRPERSERRPRTKLTR